jgi:hypothetical protein
MRSEALRVLALAVVCMLAGCRPYMMSSSAVDHFPQADQQVEFLRAVEKMPAVTNNDAFHALLMMQDGNDPNADYDARRAEGLRRGWIRSWDARSPNEAAKVGWMASAGCQVMDVKGGLTMNLFGPFTGPLPRYATRELVYMEVLPMRTENQILSGSEFVDYLNRLERLAGKNRRAKDEMPLGMPAGAASVSPGNEGAIQEGPLPQQGPRETAPEVAPAAPPAATPQQQPSQLPGKMSPSQPPPGS